MIKRSSHMIEELLTFIAVVEHKNFTKAAESIHLSQPSVSLHIKHLEEYFGCTLIQRSVKQKTIHITEEGFLLYERSKQIHKILEDTKENIKKLQQDDIYTYCSSCSGIFKKYELKNIRNILSEILGIKEEVSENYAKNVVGFKFKKRG